MMVLTNRADQAGTVMAGRRRLISRSASRPILKPVSRQSVDYSQRLVLRSNSGSFAAFAAMRRASSRVSKASRRPPSQVLFELDVAEGLTVVVPDDEAGVGLLDRPGLVQHDESFSALLRKG
jgi:hypothetical protein